MSTTVEQTQQQTVAQYVRFWNGPTADEQRSIATQVFTDDIEYHSLPGIFRSVEEMIGFRIEFVGHVGAAEFRRRAPVDQHHDRARMRWEIVLADGASFAAGTDILDFSADGRIEAVSSFVDRLPEGFDAHPAQR